MVVMNAIAPRVLMSMPLHAVTEMYGESGLRQRFAAELARRYTPRVADLVRAVTNPAHEPGRDRFEQYREHVAESLEANPWARVIKVSDFTDNGVGLIHTDPSRHVRLATKYAPLVPIF